MIKSQELVRRQLGTKRVWEDAQGYQSDTMGWQRGMVPFEAESVQRYHYFVPPGIGKDQPISQMCCLLHCACLHLYQLVSRSMLLSDRGMLIEMGAAGLAAIENFDRRAGGANDSSLVLLDGASSTADPELVLFAEPEASALRRVFRASGL